MAGYSGTPLPQTVLRIAENRPCLRCGYSLRSIRIDGVCPECAASVALSLRGDLLRYDPALMAAFARGVRLALWGFWLAILGGASLVAFALLLLTIDHFTGVFQGYSGDVTDWLFRYGFLTLFLGVALLAGRAWWLLTRSDPTSAIGGGFRRLFRTCIVVSSVAPPSGFVLNAADLLSEELGVALLFLWLAATGYCAAAVGPILRELGPRLEDHLLWRRGPWISVTAIIGVIAIAIFAFVAIFEVDERLLIGSAFFAGIAGITWIALYGELVGRARMLLRRLTAAQDDPDNSERRSSCSG